MSGSPKFKHSYGTLPNPVKKSSKEASKACNNDQKYKSGRRISFDDNIQLIDDTPGPNSSLATMPPYALNKQTNNDSHLNPSFIQGLEKLVSHRLPPAHTPHSPHTQHQHLQHYCPSSPLIQAQTKNCSSHSAALQHCSEPLYTAVVKPGNNRPKHYAPHAVGAGLHQSKPSPPPPRTRQGAQSGLVLPGSPGVTKVCCVGTVRCHNGSGDSSPEQNRYGQGGSTGGDTYRSWRAGDSGDYWQAETAHNNIWPPRCSSEEKTSSRPCDDINTGLKPRHSSVPSSPISTSSASRLWGSFRGKKPPTIDKRTLNPYLKTAS